MTYKDLNHVKAAFLVEDGFCEREFIQAEKILTKLGADCRIISSSPNSVKGWNEEKDKRKSDWGAEYAINVSLEKALPSDYDMLVMPGGARSVEKLRLKTELKPFLLPFFETKKPVIAYNDAISLLMFHDLLSGHSVAATNQLCDTVAKVGARCASTDFVVSKNLITLSRFREAEEKLKTAILAVLNNEPYIEKLVSSDNMPKSYQAA